MHSIVRSTKGHLDTGLAIILTIAIGLRLGLILLWPHYAYEDALITFRYAENLVAGFGFVYNIGEPVLGTTTPLYGLILALLRSIGLDIFVASGLFNLVCDIVSIVLLIWLLVNTIEHQANRAIAFTAGISVAAYFPFLRYNIMRMETSLFLLLAIAALAALVTEKEILLGALAGALVITRPEGMLLFALIILWLIWKRRALPLKTILSFTVIFVPYELGIWAYYGTLIPQSAIAKATIYPMLFPQHSRLDAFIALLREQLAGNYGHRFVFLPLAIAGTIFLIINSGAWFKVMLIWVGLYTLGLGFSAGPVFEWYLAPILFVYVIAVSAGVELCIEWARSSNFFPRSIQAVVGAVVILLFALGNLFIVYERTGNEYRKEIQVRQEMGEWLRKNGRSNATVILEPIGYIGYYSRLSTYDLIGLVSPRAAYYISVYGSRDYAVGWALDVGADFMVIKPNELDSTGSEKLTEFQKHYQLKRQVGDSKNEMIYQLFQRVD